jgi:hypothetical protein
MSSDRSPDALEPLDGLQAQARGLREAGLLHPRERPSGADLLARDCEGRHVLISRQMASTRAGAERGIGCRNVEPGVPRAGGTGTPGCGS